jgi:hypothetical protein
MTAVNPLTAIDLELVEIAYGVIAAESSCSTCGAPLGRCLRITRTPAAPVLAHWRLSVVTRCCGWRRHRHLADVAGRRDLDLGRFRRC